MNPDTSKGFLILSFPENRKLREKVVTIFISTLSLIVYGNHAFRSQNKQWTRTFSSIFESLTLNLK